jgi:hypothetical protein
MELRMDDIWIPYIALALKLQMESKSCSIILHVVPAIDQESQTLYGMINQAHYHSTTKGEYS